MTSDHAGERRNPWLPVLGNEPDPASVDDAPASTPPATPAPTPAPAPDLAPAKPIVPSWIVRESTPVPVEPDSDEPDLGPLVAPPPADEVLPQATKAVPTGPPVSPYDTPQARATNDAVQQLGAGAIASASLSAAGAPTPLGGVPLAPAPDAAQPPSFDDVEPLFTPRFAAAAGTDPATASGNGHGESAPSPVAGLESATLELNAEPEYHPRYEPPADPPEAETVEDEPPRRRRLWWLWVLLGLLVAGGVAWLVWGDELTPEPQVVPGAVVTEQPPEPSGEPIAIEDPTPLLAAMPSTVGTYVLTEAGALEPAEVALEYGRVADAAQTTYSDGTHAISVLALQYYDEDAAVAAWTSLVGEDVTGEAVMAGGAEVGRSAIVVQPEPGIVWRNGTTVLIATGPPLELKAFFEAFTL